MRTAKAPTTALSGKNISDDSFAISTAILAPAYAVLQPDCLDDPSSPGAKSGESEESLGGEPMDNAMTLDEAASTLGSLARGYIMASSFFINSTGDVGVGGRVFAGVVDDKYLF